MTHKARVVRADFWFSRLWLATTGFQFGEAQRPRMADPAQEGRPIRARILPERKEIQSFFEIVSQFDQAKNAARDPKTRYPPSVPWRRLPAMRQPNDRKPHDDHPRTNC